MTTQNRPLEPAVRRLLMDLLDAHSLPCNGISTDPCVRCRIERTLSREWKHTYPNGATA